MDTSTTALGWTLSMLVAHPEEDKILREAVIEKSSTKTNQLKLFHLETLKGCEYLSGKPFGSFPQGDKYSRSHQEHYSSRRWADPVEKKTFGQKTPLRTAQNGAADRTEWKTQGLGLHYIQWRSSNLSRS
ncbi:hypothetical protein GGR53DRAFT_470478 [Hypoxylon sp. FL1150]|nr:hypothetical protein GGR53DRAFT_470478 [Hypoxylon sp. FL1150]